MPLSMPVSGREQSRPYGMSAINTGAARLSSLRAWSITPLRHERYQHRGGAIIILSGRDQSRPYGMSAINTGAARLSFSQGVINHAPTAWALSTQGRCDYHSLRAWAITPLRHERYQHRGGAIIILSGREQSRPYGMSAINTGAARLSFSQGVINHAPTAW